MNDIDPHFARRARRVERSQTTVIEADEAVVDDYNYNGGLDPLPAPSPLAVRGFAGFSWKQIGLTASAVGALLWGGWMTSQLLELRSHRVVSVSIAAMANDFIAAESRSGNSAEQTDADTRAYMLTLQKVLKDHAAKGETIIVSEAVVGASVPDITSDVREAVGKLMSASPPPRVSARPAAPALAPVAPVMPQGAAMQPQPGYAPQGSYVPQGPAQAAPQQQQPMDAQPQSPLDGGPLGADAGQGGNGQ